MIPSSWAVHPEGLGEGLRTHMLSSQAFFRQMRSHVPGLVIENCSSGGHRLELSMMALCDVASFSDAHECVSIPIIAANIAGAKSVANYTDDGWCIEVALPMNDLAAGKEFSFTLQVNNCLDDGAAAGSASGSQNADYAMKCVAEEVELPVEEVVEEPAAPQTFDAGIVAAVAAIVSAAGYALSKKR